MPVSDDTARTEPPTPREFTDRVAGFRERPADTAAYGQLVADLQAADEAGLVAELSALHAAEVSDTAAAASAWATAGAAYRVVGRDERAEQAFAAALDLDPGHPQAAPTLATLLTEAERHAEAAEVIEDELAALTEQSERERGASAREALVARRAERHRALATLWEQHLGRVDRALDHWQRAWHLEPARTDALAAARSIYASLGDDKMVARLYQAELDLLGEQGPAPRRAELELALGRIIARDGDAAQAAEHLERALALAPESDQARELLAEVYSAEAGASAERAERAAELLLELGRRRLATPPSTDPGSADDPEEDGIAFLRRALGLNPGSRAVTEALAEALRHAGRWEELDQLYEHFLSGTRDPAARIEILDLRVELHESELDQPDVLRALLSELAQHGPPHGERANRLREFLRQAEDWPALAQHIEAELPALSGDRERTVAEMLELATIVREHLGDRDRAAAILHHILREIDPGNPQVLARYGDHFRERRDWRGLADLLEFAVDSAGKAGAPPTQIVRQLEEIAEISEQRMGDLDRAIHTWQRIQEFEPQSPKPAEAIRRLESRAKMWASLVGVLEQEAQNAQSPRQRADALRRIAQVYRERQVNPRRAIALYEEVLGIFPDDHAVLKALAELYEREGDDPGLAATLRRQLELDARLLAAQSGAPAEAANAAGGPAGPGANTGARDWPVAKRVERLTSLRRLATMYERLGDTDGVVFATTGVLDLLPGDRDALERVERTLEDAGDLERLEKTLSYHANAATGPAEKARVLRRLARLASLRGDEVAAMQRWDDLLRTAPNDGEAIEALAELYERHQRWEDMARVLERGLLSGRSRSAGQSGGGRASTRSGHTDSHRRASTQADAVRTGTSELRVGTGLILEPGQRRVQLERYARVVDEQLGDEQRAARAWHEVRELAPASRPALEALTRLYESLGKWRELCEVLAARIPLEQRDDPRAAAGLALRRAQLLEERLGAPGEAIRALEELIGALSPSQIEAHQALRRLYEARGDFAAAVRIAERELYLTSNSDEKIARGLGIGRLCRDQLHDPMRALQAYERVLQLAPDHPEALTAAADLYARVEDWESYIRTLERLAELAPAGAERCELMTRIAQVTAERVGDHLGAFGWYRRAYEHQPGAKTLAALRRAAETYELWSELADVYEAERARYTDDNGEPSDSGSAGLYVAACRELAAIAERRLAAPIRAMNVLLDAIHCWPQDAGLLAEAERIAVEADQRPIWQVLLECQSAALERSSRSRKVSLHSSRARVLEEHLDDPDEAVEEMLMAFAWQPDRAETRQALYDLAERRGAWKDVVAVESALLERAPSGAARIAVLRRKAEIIEERLKDPARAFRTHLVAFLLQPEDSDTVAHLWRLGRIVGSVYPDADKKPRPEPPPAYVHPPEPVLAPPPGTPPVRAQGSRPGVVMPRVDDSDISSEIPIEVEGMLPAVDPTQELSLADLAELRADDSQGAADGEENDFAGPENNTILLDLDEIDIEEDDAELGGGRPPRTDPTIELSTEDLIHTLRERPDKRNLPPPFLPGVSTGPRPGASRRPPPSPKRAPPPPPRRVKLPPLPAMPARAYESPWDEFATGYDLLPAPTKVAKMRWLFRAAEVWETGAGDIGRAFNTLARALELGVEDSEPRARLQRLTAEHGTWDRLADLYEAAAEEAKSADAAVGLLIEVAEIRSRQGRNRDTEALYRRVLGMLPRDRVARERLEALYRSEGRWVDLAASLEERTDPRFGIAVPESERPAFLRELASMYRDRLGRNHDAIDALLRLRELMPEDVEVLGELAELYGEVGRWSKVIQTLDRVGEIAEGSPEARAALRRIAEIYERELELPDRAIESYTQLVMQWSDDTEAYAALDKLLEGLGRWTDLADILRRRAGLSRDSEQRAQLLRRRAAVLTKHLNAPEEGAAALRHARTLTPDAPGLEDELVHALIAAGRAREAQALLDVRVDALLAARREQVTRRDTERDGDQPPRRAQTEPAVATSGHALSSGGARRSTAAGELGGGGDNTGGAGDVAALLIRLADLQAERLDDAVGAKATLAKVLALVPDHPTALARQVSLLESERDPRAFAEARLREAESLDDLDAKVSALMDAGVTLRDRCEDIDGARAAFEAVLAVRPYHPDATWGLAGLASEGGDPSQAAQVLETRLEDASLEPGEAARILTQLAALARQTGVGVAAERRLIEALAADPTHLPAIIARADLLGEGERYEDLEAFLRETLPGLEGAPSETLAELNRRLAVACEHLGNDDEAYQILLAAERLHRGHLLVKLALGENRYRAKRWREAALHLSSLAVHPDASRYPAEVAEGLYHAAQAEIRSLRPEKARPLYERALDLKPNFTPALHALAEQAMAQGEHQRAADFLTRQAEATEEPVERMRLFEALGDMAAATLGDQAKALTCYQSAASAAAPLESQHLPLLEKLLSHQEACGDHRGAARTAELMASFGDDAEARAGRYASAAENYLAAGDRERALAAARNAVEAEPYDLNAVTILSELLVELDAHEELAAALGRALSRPGEVSEYVAPRKALLWDRLARAREARGDVKGAIGAWERAVDVAPNSDGAMSARRALIGAWRDDAERRETSLGYRRMIALDSLALADVVTYARALCRAKHDDGGRAMLELAQVMGHPFNELDRSFLERRLVHELAAGESYRGVLGESERRTVILERGDDSDDDEQLLGPVLETLWEAAALLWPETAESLLRSGVVDAIRVTPPADIAAVDMFPRITAALDAPATVLYTSRSPEAPDVQVVCAAAPIVVLGPRILALGGEASERLALRFILGRAAEMLRPENLIAAGLPEADFNNLLGALLRLFGPESLRDFLPGEFADEESKAEYDESLRTALPVKLRDRLGALLAGASGRDVDPERFLSRLDRAADRAGLLVCGDIATALANAGSVDSQGRRESRHLFTCALSRDYLAARATLGVGVR